MINKQIIADLNPCKDRHDNYLNHYSDFSGTLTEFLQLDEITPKDKIWVAVRVMPRFLVEVFAIDCAFSAYAYAADYAGADAYAAYDATYAYAAADYAYAYVAADHAYAAATYAATAAAAYAGAAADARNQERENQVAALIMLLGAES